jgi:hypothetical protein
MLEAAVSRGSWKTAHALHKLVFESLSPRKAWDEAGLSFGGAASEPVLPGARLPWDHVCSAATRAELEAGYTKACDDM